jgi:hypothetical protein
MFEDVLQLGVSIVKIKPEQSPTKQQTRQPSLRINRLPSAVPFSMDERRKKAGGLKI